MNLCNHLLKTSILFAAAVIITSCSSPSVESVATEQEGAPTETSTVATAEETALSKENAATQKSAPDTVVLPATLRKIAQAEGDLNKDGQAELVLVVDDLQSAEDFGISRRIHIYRLENGQWKRWEEFRGGILSSESGGMMGDPFEGITIERGTIVINHFGGSRYKWRYTHRFRYQNGRWELIGATTLYGTPCEYWKTYDYNLSTGTVEVTEVFEDCDTEKETTNKFSFKHTIKPLPELHGFEPGATAVPMPKGKEDFYY
jgi:hypothetical protein